MEKELIFQILGIPETREEEVVRNAYREILKRTNPEDDPEGFKRLRQAYEEAVRLISKPETEEEKAALKNDVDLWIDRVDQLYQDLFLRPDADRWKEILGDPVCEGLDTGLEAREKMIVFLMDHSNLPHEIWKLIDQVFQITADIEALKEKYPVNFLNYMKYYVENDTFIPYRLFVPREDALTEGPFNGDGYINEYLQIKRQVDNREIEGCLQKLEDLKGFGIYHPYEDVERLRIYGEEKREEEGRSLAEELLERYEDDTYVQLYAGQILWAVGEKDRAYGLWKGILERWKDHYMAKYFSVKHLMDQKDFFNARELLIDLLDVNERDEELISFLHTVNDELIKEFRGMLEEGREDPRFPGNDLKIRLGRCLFQNERMDEAFQVMDSFSPEPSEECKYYNLYAQLLYQVKRYEEALPYLRKWLELVEGLTDDGTLETQRQMKRKPVIHALISCCHYELKEDEEGEKEAELAIKEAANKQDKTKNMHYYANRLLVSKKYEKAVDLCDQLIQEEEGYYPAYLIRQEACYHMRRAQQVVDDYHKAVRIFAGFYMPYLFATKIFFEYGQYQDAKGVLDFAHENNVEFSDEMLLYEAKVLRCLSESREDRIRPREILAQLAGKNDKGQCQLEDKSEIEFEKGLLCWNDGEMDRALSFLNEAIRKNPSRDQYRIVRGHIYLDMKKYEKALAEYRACAKSYQNAPELYYNKGCAHEGLGEIDAAIEAFKKTLTLDDRYRNTNHKLYNIYKVRYNEKNRREDYEQALYYINRRLEIRETASAYFYRAMLYHDSAQEELSLKDYGKYLEEEKEDFAAYSNMGFCYRALGEYEKALEFFQKAKEVMEKKTDSSRPYYQSGMCYKAMEKYQEALACFEEGAGIFPEDGSFLEEMGNIYMLLKEYDKAIEAYEKMMPLNSDAYLDLAWVWYEKGKLRKGIRILKNGINKTEDSNKPGLYSDLGDLYFDTLYYNKALKAYQKAIFLEKDPWKLFEYEKHAAQCCYTMGDETKAKEMAQSALDHFHEAGRDEEDYLAYKATAIFRTGDLGWIYLCLGETEKAKECFAKMEEMPLCRYCQHKKCYESTLWMGRFYESQGDYERAAQLMEETLQRYPDCVQAKEVLMRLRRKL